MIVVIDNYDSFTWNLAQYLGELGAEVAVFRNDEISIQEIEKKHPSHLVLSPGPCTPNEAGITLGLIERLAGKLPILGVCLGHQAIGQAFGGKVVRAPKPMHGKISRIKHTDKSVFHGLPNAFEATRYHSLTVARDTWPADLDITAETEDGIVMGLQHKTLPLAGVQFHPESIATEHGHKLLANFLRGAGCNLSGARVLQ